jgi:hypothetical protein
MCTYIGEIMANPAKGGSDRLEMGCSGCTGELVRGCICGGSIG